MLQCRAMARPRCKCKHSMCMNFCVSFHCLVLVAVIQPQRRLCRWRHGLHRLRLAKFERQSACPSKRSSDDSLKSPEIFMRQTCKRMWGRNFPGFARRPGFSSGRRKTSGKARLKKKDSPQTLRSYAAFFKKKQRGPSSTRVGRGPGHNVEPNNPTPSPTPSQPFFLKS